MNRPFAETRESDDDAEETEDVLPTRPDIPRPEPVNHAGRPRKLSQLESAKKKREEIAAQLKEAERREKYLSGKHEDRLCYVLGRICRAAQRKRPEANQLIEKLIAIAGKDVDARDMEFAKENAFR